MFLDCYIYSDYLVYQIDHQCIALLCFYEFTVSLLWYQSEGSCGSIKNNSEDLKVEGSSATQEDRLLNIVKFIIASSSPISLFKKEGFQK